MNSALIIAELLLKYGPDVALGVAAIFNKPNPTLEDWQKVFDLAKKSYDQYVRPQD